MAAAVGRPVQDGGEGQMELLLRRPGTVVQRKVAGVVEFQIPGRAGSRRFVGGGRAMSVPQRNQAVVREAQAVVRPGGELVKRPPVAEGVSAVEPEPVDQIAMAGRVPELLEIKHRRAEVVHYLIVVGGGEIFVNPVRQELAGGEEAVAEADPAAHQLRGVQHQRRAGSALDGVRHHIDQLPGPGEAAQQGPRASDVPLLHRFSGVRGQVLPGGRVVQLVIGVNGGRNRGAGVEKGRAGFKNVAGLLCNQIEDPQRAPGVILVLFLQRTVSEHIGGVLVIPGALIDRSDSGGGGSHLLFEFVERQSGQPVGFGVVFAAAFRYLLQIQLPFAPGEHGMRKTGFRRMDCKRGCDRQHDRHVCLCHREPFTFAVDEIDWDKPGISPVSVN